jgi:hypothetical protein
MSISKKLDIRKTDKGGALFAKEDIKKDEILIKMEGNILQHASRSSLQIDEDKHLHHALEEDTLANHSCNPNGYINFNDLTFRALHDIKEGEEITFNYLTTEWDMNEKFECLCKSKNCFKYIRGFKYLTPQQKKSLEPFISPLLKKRLHHPI